jgi:excisionase family DNA binding protein
MSGPIEVTITGIDYWAEKTEQLAHLLATSRASAIPDPSGRPVNPNHMVVLTHPARWAQNPREFRDAVAYAIGETESTNGPGSRFAAGAVAPVGDRLVFTVLEAAQLLGISRSFAYEAVQRGEIPSMRIGRRILVPKAALERFLAPARDGVGTDRDISDEPRG